MSQLTSLLSRVRLSAGYRVQRTGRWLLGQATPSVSEALAREALNDDVLARFYDERVGADYPSVNRQAKEELVAKIRLVNERIPSGTSPVTHITLATEILSIPASVKGDIVECGCWKGASTASLSLVCALAGRKLVVCDSFEGLPDDEQQTPHEYPHLKVFGFYQKGMYSGRLEEVKKNIDDYGNLSVCEFVPGFFSDSLKSLAAPVAFAFLDVDLVSSMRDCIRYIWPLLVENGRVYTDDSGDMAVVSVWFDEAWWREQIGQSAPGYVGSGCGLPIDPSFSPLGYTQKVHDPSQAYGRIAWLHYHDAPNPEGLAQFPQQST